MASNMAPVFQNLLEPLFATAYRTAHRSVDAFSQLCGLVDLWVTRSVYPQPVADAVKAAMFAVVRPRCCESRHVCCGLCHCRLRGSHAAVTVLPPERPPYCFANPFIAKDVLVTVPRGVQGPPVSLPPERPPMAMSPPPGFHHGHGAPRILSSHTSGTIPPVAMSPPPGFHPGHGAARILFLQQRNMITQHQFAPRLVSSALVPRKDVMYNTHRHTLHQSLSSTHVLHLVSSHRISCPVSASRVQISHLVSSQHISCPVIAHSQLCRRTTRATPRGLARPGPSAAARPKPGPRRRAAVVAAAARRGAGGAAVRYARFPGWTAAQAGAPRSQVRCPRVLR